MHPYRDVENEYINKFNQIGRGFMEQWKARGELVKQYSWAIPNNKAIETIVKYSPIIEIGAGTGYWGRLISKAGGDIVCYDKNPPHKYKNDFAECSF